MSRYAYRPAQHHVSVSAFVGKSPSSPLDAYRLAFQNALMPNNFVYIIFFVVLGRRESIITVPYAMLTSTVYVNSMLASLNSRAVLRDGLEISSVTHHKPSAQNKEDQMVPSVSKSLR
jgi:hypothetical protein